MKILLLLSVVFLVACSESNVGDLEEFIAQTTAKPKGRIAPLPEFKPYSAFIYSASAMRSPFESPVVFEEMTSRVDDTPHGEALVFQVLQGHRLLPRLAVHHVPPFSHL